jgi:glycine/serine hydroxymethyltransferase
LRLGVSEMTRFGMKEDDFRSLAELIHDVVDNNKKVADSVKGLRSRFLDLRFCFQKEDYGDLWERLHSLL